MERLSRRSPEFKVGVEYSAHCDQCNFTISDSVQDINEKDAKNNVLAICKGWHYTIHRLNNSSCDGEIIIRTKTTYFK